MFCCEMRIVIVAGRQYIIALSQTCAEVIKYYITVFLDMYSLNVDLLTHSKSGKYVDNVNDVLPHSVTNSMVGR
jgi:hypothetical protein